QELRQVEVWDRLKHDRLEAQLVTADDVRRRIEQLHETNPMLGHRGCRLSITYPEILEMQVRAIVDAAAVCAKCGLDVRPEIMIPLSIDGKELAILVERTHDLARQRLVLAFGTKEETDKLTGLNERIANLLSRVAQLADTGREEALAQTRQDLAVATSDRARLLAKSKAPKKLSYMVGTMIETPRAALTADRIAESAEFFSFGTNDLTQTTMGLSRDDAGRFLPDYVDQDKAAIFEADPFERLDTEGVGQLVRMGIEKGRSVKPKLKIGICGEHGGEAHSVRFCHHVGMDYVSCSPYRVPVARLAAAQAVLEQTASKPTKHRSAAARKTKARPTAAKKTAKKKTVKKSKKKTAKKSKARKAGRPAKATRKTKARKKTRARKARR
ncbi:MAG: putative PEP-binding protein, partial [Phycisphaerae bacterium]